MGWGSAPAPGGREHEVEEAAGFTEVRLVMLGMCALLAAGVFSTMFLSIWSTRRAPAAEDTLPQHLAAELVWAAIPCLIVLAAAIPAVIAIVSAP